MKKNLRNLKPLEQSLGYSFNSRSLIERALSHRSYAKDNNERLEFLGDSLLNIFMAEAVYLKFPKASEGELSRLRSYLVKGETLAELAREHAVGDFLYLGEGELKSGGFRRSSILEDAIEALIGAVYLDSDIIICKQFVLQCFESRLTTLTMAYVEKDPKTRLQEYLQSRGKPLPRYRILQETGQSHIREYEVEVDIGVSYPRFSTIAPSKRAAEKEVAQMMLSHIENEKNV
ncbi:MAG: ribonuclease-3 [Flavobacteriales bacterium]|jgi:ribonuclease-3